MSPDASHSSRLRWRSGATAALVLSLVIFAGPKASMPITITGMGMALASLADPLRAGMPRARLLALLGVMGALAAIAGSLTSASPALSIALLAAVVWTSSLLLLVHPTWTWVLYLSTVWLIAVLNMPGGPPERAFLIAGCFLLGVALYTVGTLVFPGPEVPAKRPPPATPRVVHRFALVRTIAVTLSGVVGWNLGSAHHFWPAAATHFVVRPTWKETPGAALWRAVGTASGAMAAVSIALLWSEPWVMKGALWVSGTAIFLMGHPQGGAMMFWVTLFLMAMLSISGADILRLGPERILTDVIGLAIGLVADGLLRRWLADEADERAS